MSFPLVHLVGNPYAQGFEHGRALRDRIAENLVIYFGRFEREARLARAEVTRRATLYLAALETQNPAYVAALRGVADGSGFDLLDIVALNVRYELLYYETGQIALAEAGQAKPDGCTAFAIPPDASDNGHLLLGENWDWIPGVRGAILHTVDPDGLETLSFTEAGIVGGKIGLNSAGLGLAINGLSTAADDWARLSPPFHLRCYEILRCRDLDGAIGVIAGAERACSAHFLLARAPDRVVGVEAAPSAMLRRDDADACLVHANHFLDPAALGVVETSAEDRAHSCHRQARLEALLAAKTRLSVTDVKAALRDHDGYPNSVCWHPDPAVPPDEQYATVVSVVMDLTARTLDLADGPPCVNDFRRFALKS